MTHRLTTDYAKNYCNRTLIVKVIVENVVTCFFFLGGGHSVHTYVHGDSLIFVCYRNQFLKHQIDGCRCLLLLPDMLQ